MKAPPWGGGVILRLVTASTFRRRRGESENKQQAFFHTRTTSGTRGGVVDNTKEAVASLRQLDSYRRAGGTRATTKTPQHLRCPFSLPLSLSLCGSSCEKGVEGTDLKQNSRTPDA